MLLSHTLQFNLEIQKTGLSQYTYFCMFNDFLKVIQVLLQIQKYTFLQTSNITAEEPLCVNKWNERSDPFIWFWWEKKKTQGFTPIIYCVTWLFKCRYLLSYSWYSIYCNISKSGFSESSCLKQVCNIIISVKNPIIQVCSKSTTAYSIAVWV